MLRQIPLNPPLGKGETCLANEEFNIGDCGLNANRMIGGIGMFPLPAPVGTVLMIVLMIGIFYFILIRPQQKKMKRHQSMINNLSKGDQVVTEGGIYGSVVGLKENVVVLRIASVRDEDVKIEVSRARIAFLNKGGELIEGE